MIAKFLPLVSMLYKSERSWELQSNWENREHQKYFWNVIVLQEKSQSGLRKLNRKQEC